MKPPVHKLRSLSSTFGIGMAVLLAVPGAAEEPDYAAELPRIAPREPAEALASFRVVEGYRIELAAAEPLVKDPVALDFDERGRLAVVEMGGYSEQADQPLGRVRVLEDRDGDGTFDESRLFAEFSGWPTAAAWYDGGLFVGVAPDLLYLRDDDGDGRADRQETVFTGFGRSNVQGLLNSFQWGLDNRLHGAASSSGGDVRALAAADEPPLSLRGRDFAFEPRTRRIEAVSGGAQHGLSFNRWGDQFVCHNSDHCQWIAVEQRYLERNPYQTAGGARRSIAAEGPQAEVFRTSPVEPWRLLRTRLRLAGVVPGVVEGGGRPAGYFTSATGITSYEGDAWPADQRGVLLVSDVGSNLIHRKRLTAVGAGLRAERIDQGREFVTSDDIWFRPVQMANGPDGALYVADMYREVIEHPLSLPESIKRHLDLMSGSDRGRIYRIVPDGFRQRPAEDLGALSTAELAQRLEHPNAWHRRTAARLLHQRQDASANAALASQARQAAAPESRIASLSALDGLGGLAEETLREALRDPHPEVRRHALILAEPRLGEAPLLRRQLVDSAGDSAPRPARQAAFAIGALAPSERLPLLVELVRRHPDDPEILAAAATSLSAGAAEAVETLLADDAFGAGQPAQDFLRSLLAQIGAQQRPDDLNAVLRMVRSAAEDPARVGALLGGLGVQPGSGWFQELVGDARGIGGERFARLLAAARATASTSQADDRARCAALRLLRWGPVAELQGLIEPLLVPDQPLAVQAALLDGLAASEDAATAEALLARWPQLMPAVRQQAAGVLYSRPVWALAVLEAIVAEQLTAADFGRTRLAEWARHPDADVRARAKTLLEAAAPPSAEATLAEYRGVLESAGDAAQGASVFRRHCAACHQHQGIGYPLGPNLASAATRGPEAVLYNIVAPNSEVDPRYHTYVALTDEGRVYSGILADESSATITLRRGESAVDTLPRSQIVQLENTGQSLMPEGLVREMDRNALADLLQFLCAPN